MPFYIFRRHYYYLVLNKTNGRKIESTQQKKGNKCFNLKNIYIYRIWPSEREKKILD